MPLHQDASSCHHCHIHAPIPSKDLKRTHPLRSSFVADRRQDSVSSRHDLARAFKKNVSFLYGRIQRRDGGTLPKETRANGSVPPPPPPPPPPPAPPMPRHIRTVDLPPVVVVEASKTHAPVVSSPVSLPLVHSVPVPSTVLPPLRAASVTPPPAPAPLRGDARARRRKDERGMAGVQAAVLIGAYALLLVLAIVIGVVLSQQQTRGRIRGRPRVGAPVRGAAPAPLGDGPIRIGRPRAGRPVAAPRPAPPPPPPPTTSSPDFDYVYVDDLADDFTLLPNPVSANPPPPPPPTAPAFRPLPAPRRPEPQPAAPRPPPPRRQNIPLASIDRDFSLNGEDNIRGRKEPEVKILRSWSHQNADGTFSWGYINTDGSFKNETRGLDCVVHGVYGYIDKETGEQLSFPYTSGNPCDPDAPDYYYDYDTNVMIVNDGGQQFTRPGASPRPRPRQG